MSSIPNGAFSLEEMKPDERVYEVRVLLKDVPGALAKVGEMLADANVNLKTGSAFYVRCLATGDECCEFKIPTKM